jgi:hypothetical protein
MFGLAGLLSGGVGSMYAVIGLLSGGVGSMWWLVQFCGEHVVVGAALVLLFYRSCLFSQFSSCLGPAAAVFFISATLISATSAENVQL